MQAELPQSSLMLSPRGDRPKVSIGLPVYNGEKFLECALASLLAQDFHDFELVISDNASTDKTTRICLEYAAKDSRIRYYRSEVHREAADNFNCVLGLSRGEYFMWAAHDDLWEPSFVRHLVSALDRNPGAVLAFAKYDAIDEYGRQARVFREDWGEIFSRRKFWQLAYMIILDEAGTQKANHIYGVMRRDALRAVGGMTNLVSGHSGADVVTLLRLLACGDFVIVDDLLYHYRIRRRPPPRGGVPLMLYLFRRIARRVHGHEGNLVTALISDREYLFGMRWVVLNEAPVSRVEKLLLCCLIEAKRVWRPLRRSLVAVKVELLEANGSFLQSERVT